MNNKTRRGFFSLGVLFFFIRSSIADEPVFFPLQEGNYWLYRNISDASWGTRVEVRSRSENLVTLVKLTRLEKTRVLRDRGSEIDIELPKEGFKLYYNFKLGQVWEQRYPADCFDHLSVSMSIEQDPIVTEAGTFHDCLRLDFGGGFCRDAGKVREWWAPGVGLVEWLQDNVAGLQTFELVEYCVKGADCKKENDSWK